MFKYRFKQELNRKINLDFFILFFILSLYPFIVVPSIKGYFTYPRYVLLSLASFIMFPIILKERKHAPKFILLTLSFFAIFIITSTFKAINQDVALFGTHGIMSVRLITSELKKQIIVTSSSRFTGLSTYAYCIILFFAASMQSEYKRLISFMIASAGIVSVISILQNYGINFVPHEMIQDGFTPYATIGQPNFLGTYTVFILPAAMIYYFATQKKRWLISSSLIFAGLLLSNTRGCWIAFLVTLLIFVIYIIKKKAYAKQFLTIIICFILIASILLPSNNGELINRVQSINSNIVSGMKLEDSAGSGRMYIWKETMKIIPSHWAFGMGPDNLIYAGIISNGSIVDKAHNIYIEIAVTMGIFALLFYLLFMSFFINPEQGFQDIFSFMFFSMIIAYLNQGFFNIDSIMVMPLFWIVLGFSLRNYTEYSKNKKIS